jgi:hypothetical protein
MIPAVKEAARGRQLEARAAKELARFSSAPPIGNPFRELMSLAGEARAWRRSCEQRVTELEDVRYESTMGLEQLRSEIGMYQAAMRLSADICLAIGKLDCEAKLARINDQTAEKLTQALDRAAGVLKLAPEARRALWGEYAKQLRELDAVEKAAAAESA